MTLLMHRMGRSGLLLSFIAVALLSVAPAAAITPPTAAPASIGSTIFGADGRVQIADTTQTPYRNVALLNIRDATGTPVGSCSGSFLSANLVITAAHCLWQNGAYQPSIEVIPAANGTSAPFGSAVSTSYAVPARYQTLEGTGNEFADDYGLIFLSGSPFGNSLAPYMPIADVSDAYFEQSQIAIASAGYPGDKPQGTMWFEQTFVGAFDPTYLYSQLDEWFGQSGSPIYTLDRTARQFGYLISVVSSGTASYNSSVRFTAPVISALQGLCAPVRCSIPTSTAVVGVASSGPSSLSLTLAMASGNRGNPGTAIATARLLDNPGGSALSGQAVSFTVTGSACSPSLPTTLTTTTAGTAPWTAVLDRAQAGSQCSVTASSGSLQATATFTVAAPLGADTRTKRFVAALSSDGG